MFKAKTIISISACVLGLVIAGFVRSDKKEPKNYVLLVSFDAFRYDYPVIYNTPNMNILAKDGIKADRMISSFPTNTFPNHYSIATGLYPDHHGLINNSFPAPDLGMFYRMGDRQAVENPAFYGGEPMWVTAQKQGLRAASFFWVGSEAPVGGMHPTYWKKYDESTGYGERIDTVMKWFTYSEERRPRLVTLYFDEPDATSHSFGPESEETKEVVESLDSLVGVIRGKIALLPFADRVNLIVLSDHGMASVSPEKYINLKSVVPDRMIESISGGNPVYLINPASGKADSVLLLINSTSGVKAWRKSELPEKWHYGTHPRIPEIVVVADSSWSIGTRPSASRSRGAHGYDNQNPELYSIFYAAGPAFKKNRTLQELNNVDVYNIVCKILNLKPAPNDGNPKVLGKVLR
ncbi:MAG TPA: ectonucleotide pyrophosphatase/phosphodiesterase [Bacteroidales bacterium]|nr:ectonucleotide pyrophosphatase/phosphodiesterase [Bacteroidales bacterium]